MSNWAVFSEYGGELSQGLDSVNFCQKCGARLIEVSVSGLFLYSLSRPVSRSLVFNREGSEGALGKKRHQ